MIYGPMPLLARKLLFTILGDFCLEQCINCEHGHRPGNCTRLQALMVLGWKLEFLNITEHCSAV